MKKTAHPLPAQGAPFGAHPAFLGLTAAQPFAWRSLAAWAQQAWSRPRTAQTVALILAAWLCLTANWALWLMPWRVQGYSGSPWSLLLILIPIVFACVSLLFSLTAWPRGMKPVWIALLVLATFGQYFMLNYGTVIDKGMVLNVFQTDLHESADLFNPQMVLQLFFIAGLPSLWLIRLKVIGDGALRNALRTAALLVGSLALLAAVMLPTYRVLAPVVRNNTTMRFMINPANSLIALADAKLKPLFVRPKPFVSITGGAVLGASYGPANAATAVASTTANKPPLFVLVVGETGRGDHYALNGYGRDTNPELAKLPVVSWSNAHSCATNTRESLPCMFSPLAKADYDKRRADNDTLLDVLQAAGLAVLWVDNQAGCKGVCDRVASASTEDAQRTPAGQQLCTDGECLDEMLLEGLDARIAKLPQAQRDKGVVLVLHEMGSHGPAYYRRSSAATKAFQPECATNALSSCTHEQLINVYDNSIRYNDHFLAKTTEWLQQHKAQYQTGMLYLSDHGESLGEGGIYLHGLPYMIAPEEQKHIAVIAWLDTLAARTGVDTACLARTHDTPVTHDNLYHTVLGLMDVHSPTYQPALDMFQACRSSQGA